MDNFKSNSMDLALSSISELAEKHRATSDAEDAELIEIEAIHLISDYCVDQGYEINGFPFKLTDKNIDIEEHYELHDSSVFEAYNQYVDFLALEKDDVAGLMWHFTKTFWPKQFKSKSEYLEHLKGLLESGAIYEFKL